MLMSMLDTNLCVRALRDRSPHIREQLRKEADSVCISTVILYELHVGAQLSARPEENLVAIDRFAGRMQVLDFDDAAAAHAAEIRADLTRRGQIIGANDLLIAGHARSRGLRLITGNLGEFTRVKGLRCEDWL